MKHAAGTQQHAERIDQAIANAPSIGQWWQGQPAELRRDLVNIVIQTKAAMVAEKVTMPEMLRLLAAKCEEANLHPLATMALQAAEGARP
jgi:hypothetical protein